MFVFVLNAISIYRLLDCRFWNSEGEWRREREGERKREQMTKRGRKKNQRCNRLKRRTTKTIFKFKNQEMYISCDFICLIGFCDRESKQLLSYHTSTFIRTNRSTRKKRLYVYTLHRYAISGRKIDCGGARNHNNNNLHSNVALCLAGAAFIVSQSDGVFYFTLFLGTAVDISLLKKRRNIAGIH